MVKEIDIEAFNEEIIGDKEDYINNSYLLDGVGYEFPCQDNGTSKHQSLRLCMSCGKPFYGARDHFLCPSCAEDRKKSKPALTKICKDCGTEFLGHHNERRCPRCVEAALQESYRRYWDKGGTQRPMGSTDKCILCGKEYTVASSSQKYCSDECRHKASIPKLKEYKKKYYRTSERAAELRYCRQHVTKICVYCLQPFKSNLATNVCSDYCRSEHQKIVLNKSYFRRGLKNDYAECVEKRTKYREQLKNGNAQDVL